MQCMAGMLGPFSGMDQGGLMDTSETATGELFEIARCWIARSVSYLERPRDRSRDCLRDLSCESWNRPRNGGSITFLGHFLVLPTG